jgi:GntR family transcriptional regulator
MLMAEELFSQSAALKSAPGRLYENIAALIRQRIESGHWVPRERLPSIEELARTFGVAVVTVRQALRLLETDGLVKRRRGSGTYVAEHVKERQWLKLESSWDALIQMWGKSRPRPIKVLDAIGMPLLGPEDGTSAPAYRYMRRVHLADEVPYAVIDLYLDRRLYVLHPDRFDSEMAIVVLDSMPDVTINSMRQCLTIGTADLETARLLNVAVNSPVGKVRRVIRDQNDTAIYIGIAVYRGDLVKLEREVKRR